MSYDYEIDTEVQIDGRTLLAVGTLEIYFSRYGFSRSIGEPGGVDIEGYGSAEISLIDPETGDEHGPLPYTAGHPVFAAVVAACDADIVEATKSRYL